MATDSTPAESGVKRIGPVRVFMSNPLAVIGLVIITLFALMVVVHPLLMATVWDGQTRIYDPVTGHDAPIVEATVVERVTDLTTELGLDEARLKT